VDFHGLCSHHQPSALVAGCCLLFSDRPLFSIHTGSRLARWLLDGPTWLSHLFPHPGSRLSIFFPGRPPPTFTPYTLPFRCWLLVAGPGPWASLMSLAVQCLRPVPSPMARTLEPLPGDAHRLHSAGRLHSLTYMPLGAGSPPPNACCSAALPALLSCTSDLTYLVPAAQPSPRGRTASAAPALQPALQVCRSVTG
jgi:hypothetical protein